MATRPQRLPDRIMPPPPFSSRFAGPPQLRGFPPPGFFPGGLPPLPQPPQPFSPFPPFSASERGLLSSPAYPPPPRPPFLPPPPSIPPWPPEPRGAAQAQWRPEAAPSPAERPRPEGGGDDDDERWLSRFLSRLPRPSAASSPPGGGLLSASRAAQVASEALRLVAQVAAACAAWRRGEEPAEEEAAAVEARLAELREVVRPLRGAAAAEGLARAERRRAKRRLRRRQARQEARAARQEEEARRAEREARIDRWRARRAQEVDERRREQELKAAADSVLSEVRKKQADTKRMAEILRGLEKLRKLRKEAAGRKGVCPPPAADEAFENEIQSLKASIKKRTELYEAEERALRVMLEGEQEEERKREMEKKQKKEKEKLLQQKREMESKLFGDPEEFPLAHLLEPFRQYYLQAEYSVPALIHIRHEWDRYLVPADRPEGSSLPPGWVLPSLPSSDIWATAVG